VREAGFGGDIGERAVVIVVIEVARRCFASGQPFQSRAIHNENIRPAIIVVVKDGNAGSRRFNDVFLCIFAAENDRCGEPSLLRHINEMHNRLGVCAVGTSANTWRISGLYREPSASPKPAEEPDKRGMESHLSLIIARSGP
jgi:hypothetical protein